MLSRPVRLSVSLTLCVDPICRTVLVWRVSSTHVPEIHSLSVEKVLVFSFEAWVGWWVTFANSVTEVVGGDLLCAVLGQRISS